MCVIMKQGMKRTHHEAGYEERLRVLAGLRASSSHQASSAAAWLDSSHGALCLPFSLHADGAPRGAPDEMMEAPRGAPRGAQGWSFIADGAPRDAKGWSCLMEKHVALEEVIQAKQSLLERHLVLQPSPPDIPPPI